MANDRLELLKTTVTTPGTYVCTVPGCKTKQRKDGFCSTHQGVPLRLLKRKR